MTGPSPHLSWAELACHDSTPYPEEWRTDRAVELALAFERVREIYGGPLLISSAYRTPEYNARINDGAGGAKQSQHCQGRALDLHPWKAGAGLLGTLQRAAVQARKEGLIRGIGFYRNFVHIDTRPGKTMTWYGDRAIEGNIAL